MLYSILPPILVVLSLVGIIIFLVRKAPQVSRLGQDESPGNPSEIDLREPGFLGRSARRMRETDWRAGKNFFLAILGKIARALRSASAKVGGLFSRAWEGARNRGKKEPARSEPPKDERIMTEDQAMMEKVRNYMPEKKIVIKNPAAKPKAEKLPAEPMVSKKAVKPRTEMKDRLEELLIERIAANPKDIEAYGRLGQYYMEIENYEYAKECYKQVVKLNPLDRSSKFTLKKLERLLSE